MSFAALETSKLSLDNSATRAALRGIPAQWAAAFNAGDVDRLVELYDPEAIKFPASSFTPIVGLGALRRYFSKPEWNGASVELKDETEIRLTGERSAVVAGSNQFFLPLGETLTPLQVRYSFVLVRHIRSWRITHDHSSLIPPVRD
jgi:uncharacterized protein (TIGR02246 family)